MFTQRGDARQLTDEVEMGGDYRMDGALVCDRKVSNLRHVLCRHGHMYTI